MADLGLETNEIVAAGCAAWARLKRNQGQTWDAWCSIGRALEAGQTAVMRQLGVNTPHPKGRTWNKHFGGFLRETGFIEINQGTRSMLLKCMTELPAIEEWRERIGPERAGIYNHPQSVWRHFAPLRRGAGRGTGHLFDLSTPEKITTTAQQFCRRYGETAALAFADAILEVINAVPAAADETALALAAAQA